MWQYLYLFIIFSAAGVCTFIAFYAWRNRHTNGALLFSGMMLAVAEWLFTSGLVSMSHTPEQAIYWIWPRFFGLTTMVAFFITYAIQYTGHEKWLTRGRYIFIFSVPIVTQLVLITNPLHHLFIREVVFSPDGILMGLDAVRYGPLFWVHTVYSYTLVLICVGLIVDMSIRTFHLYRRQAVLMVIGVLPTIITSAIDAFILIPGMKHPLSPLGFAFMGISISLAMFHFRMLDIVPVARDTVIESMSDGMIVLDGRDNIIDINTAACQYLRLDAALVIGKAAYEILKPLKNLFYEYKEQSQVATEIYQDIAGQERWFDLRISQLKKRNGKSSGRVIILRDITARKEAEIQLLDTLAEVKLHQEQLYEQIIRDPLTNLYNRRFLGETFQREMGRAAREQYPVSIIMMDIDHFKVVNDTYGHEAGDVVLKRVADILVEQTRTSDYVFRYGGEEFLVVLPATGAEAAYHMAERWRHKLQRTRVSFDEAVIRITMSMGIAAYLPGEGTPEEALSAADQAMYCAKAEGRNCCVIKKRLDISRV